MEVADGQDRSQLSLRHALFKPHTLGDGEGEDTGLEIAVDLR